MSLLGLLLGLGNPLHATEVVPMTLRTKPFAVVVATLALALALANSAQAQQDAFTLPVERFRPTIDDKGLGTTESGDIPTHFGFHTGLVVNYALNPLVLRNGDGTPLASIISHRLAGNGLFSIGFFDYVSVGVDIPLTFVQIGGEVPDNLADAVGVANGLAGIGVGDIKLVPKVRVLREDRHFVSLAFIPALTLPTAGGFNFTPAGAQYEYGGSYLGEGPGAFAFIPEVAVSTNVAGIRLAGNLAYRLRQPVRFLGVLDINPEVVYRGGIGYDLSKITSSMTGLMLFAELYGATPDRNPFGLIRTPNADEDTQNIEEVEARLTNPLEWGAGGRWHLGKGVFGGVLDGMSLEAGFGTGLAAGYGSPDVRIFGGVRYGVENRDRDADGIEDAVDQCPDDPEDKDEHEDTDGCPDPDNDSDGLPDTADACRNKAEDPDGFKDDDGCPEDDNDNDTVLDKDDSCRDVPGHPNYLGCPAPDRDGDTVPDEDDKCPDVPGVVELAGCPDRDGDGVEDSVDECPDEKGGKPHGCPDTDGDGIMDLQDRCVDKPGTIEFNGCPDTDKDGIADPDDKCPEEPETINGIDDTDGCPDKGKILVVVTKERIELAETIYFDSGKATIQKRSFPLLQQLAQVLKAHPEVKKVAIEGHTDDQGPDNKNLDLSKRRAASVVTWLTENGVAADRLASDGFGESKPIDTNKNKAGREKNRRVDLRIIEQD